MGNFIDYALNYVKTKIPNKVLMETFMKDLPYARGNVRSLDSRIKQLVFQNIVKRDIDATGGREMSLNIGGLAPIAIESNGLVYKIPMEMTNGKAITSCRFASFIIQSTVSAGYGSAVGNAGNALSASSMANTLSALNFSSSPDPVTGSADCQVLDSGANTIFIKCRNRQKIYWLLVDVENDDNLNHINPKSYKDLAKLYLYATQAYIYNKLVIEMGAGMLQGGAELGPFKDTVERYSDASDNYDDYLRDEVDVILMLNDPRKKEEHYFMVTGGKRF